MQKSLSKPFVLVGIIILTLFTSCEPANVRVTPNPEVLNRWGNRESTVTSNRLGHGTVYAMALSPDGKTIAVSGILSICVYDFDSLELSWCSTIEPSQPPVSTGRGQVTWSPDGKQIATISEIGLTVWDAKTGERLQILKGYQYQTIDAVAWTQDGRLTAFEYFNGHIVQRDLETNTQLFEFDTAYVPALYDLLQGADLLAVGLSDQLIVWDTHQKKNSYPPIKVCDGYCIYGVKWSPDGSRVATVSPAKLDQIIVWDVKSGNKIFATEAPGNFAGTKLAWSPDGNLLAAAFDNGTIRLWNVQSRKQIQEFRVDKPVSLAWSLDGSNLVTLSQYESIIVWNVKTGTRDRSLGEHTSWVLNLAWSPDGTMLASGSEDGVIIIRESPSGKIVRSIHDPGHWIENLAWSPDGARLASTSQDMIKIWKVQTGKPVLTWSAHSWTLPGLAWSPDGSMLASISYEGSVTLWDASSGNQLRILGTNRFTANLAWSPQSDVLGADYPPTVDSGEQIVFWDPQTGTTIRTQPGLSHLTWSPDGNVVASISNDGTAYGGDDTALVLWDPKTGQELHKYETESLLGDISWSPDGKYLVVGESSESDKALIVLDAQTGEELHQLRGHYDAVTQVAWSPRGDVIASSSWDGTVILWQIETP